MDGECPLHKSTEKKFNVGQVDFINCLPVNFPIENGDIHINAEVVNGVPSELNRLILNDEIDIAPVSSVTYIENKHKLVPVGDLCIASNGPADSVLLFSKFPINELDGAKILLSSASATSNKLVQIVVKEFLNLNARFELNSLNQENELVINNSNYSAQLLIGDHALLEFSKKPRDIFIYDLGSLWKKYTGLPMVFGIWVVRKETQKQRSKEIEVLGYKLQQAKELGLGKLFDSVIKKAQERILLPKDFYSDYFKHLSYDYTEQCKLGLNTFESLLFKYSLLENYKTRV